MATKTVAFRLNAKTREDQEIMDWLDEVVHKYEIYDSYTEAVKWAVLSFLRGEVRSREELDTVETMQEFVRDFARQSKLDNENLVQDIVTRTLATVLGAMGHQGYGYPQKPAPVSFAPMQTIPENMLGYSETPMDEGTAASLSAMFADDDD